MESDSLSTEAARLIGGTHKGSYAVILRSTAEGGIRVGRGGVLAQTPGYYVYLGSAFGPGGVAARVGHHLHVTHKPHWHIDYLRRHTAPTEVWWSFDPLAREHHWAAVLGSSPRTRIPLAGFGASDCNCRSHLFFSPGHPSFRAFSRRLHRAFPGHGRIYHQIVD